MKSADQSDAQSPANLFAVLSGVAFGEGGRQAALREDGAANRPDRVAQAQEASFGRRKSLHFFKVFRHEPRCLAFSEMTHLKFSEENGGKI